MPAPGPPPRRAPRPVRRRTPAVYAEEYRYMLQRLREAREALGLTQREVAAALGRPISYVSKCELAERRMDPIDLMQFARVYQRPITDFLPHERGR